MKFTTSLLAVLEVVVASRFDPIHLLQNRRDSKSLVFSQAVSLLRGFEHAPSCYRNAAQALVNDCQRLQDTYDEATGDELIYGKYNYALSLAVCDLTAARKSIDSACDSFSEPALKKSAEFGNGRPSKVARELTNGCMEALGQDPILWDSFNSNKAQALTICQASREEMEKDEILSTYRATGKVVESFNELLEVYAEQWRKDDELHQASNNRMFQNIFGQLNLFKDEISSMATILFRDLTGSARRAEEAMNTVSLKASDIETLFNGLRKDIHRVHGEHILAERSAAAAHQDLSQSVIEMNTEVIKMSSYMDRIVATFITIQSNSLIAKEQSQITNEALATLQIRVDNATESMILVNDLTDNHKEEFKQFSSIMTGLIDEANSLQFSILSGGLSSILTSRILGVSWWVPVITTPLLPAVGFMFVEVSLQRFFRLAGSGLIAPFALNAISESLLFLGTATQPMSELEETSIDVRSII